MTDQESLYNRMRYLARILGAPVQEELRPVTEADMVWYQNWLIFNEKTFLAQTLQATTATVPGVNYIYPEKSRPSSWRDAHPFRILTDEDCYIPPYWTPLKPTNTISRHEHTRLTDWLNNDVSGSYLARLIWNAIAERPTVDWLD